MSKHEKWIDDVLPKHKRITESVVTILENLLKSQGIEYLSVSGRTKNKQSALEKIIRKSYKSPNIEMTDLSGIRIIVFFESDIVKVSEIIKKSFTVDNQNSRNQDEKLPVNQTGYRSVHFVCDLGKARTELPEFEGLSGLKFEIQVRTVLQHAWAELAHDRNYKFSGNLPPSIERNLYLYAGMLEIADKGFSDLSKQIDEYINTVHQKNIKGEFSYNLDDLSLQEFVESWATNNNINLQQLKVKTNLNELLNELKQYGIVTATQLNEIIPKNYAEVCKKTNFETTILGTVRRWMIINDWKKFISHVSFDWVLSRDIDFFTHFIPSEELDDFKGSFEWDDTPHL